MSKYDYKRYIQLLKELTEFYDQHGVEYIMADGTLLGSYVMHDMIPWDDDLDLMVKYEDYLKLKSIYQQPTFSYHFVTAGYHDMGNEWSTKTLKKNKLGTMNKVWGTKRPAYHKHKVYYRSDPKILHTNWAWPYIDVKFYKQNITHLWNFDYHNRLQYSYLNEFYPLLRRPFAGMWLPAPRDTGRFLRNKYETFKCKSGFFNHRKERAIPKNEMAELDCRELLNGTYPYVKRRRCYKEFTIESLWHKNCTLYESVIEVNCDKKKPFQI